jgi:hypothetical protein
MSANATPFAVLHIYHNTWGIKWCGLVYGKSFDAIVRTEFVTNLAADAF